MTPENQRIVIAEACGWKRGVTFESSLVKPSTDIERPCWFDPRGIVQRKIPDYLNDLNAMHEAEKYLVESFKEQEYAMALHLIVRNRVSAELQNWFAHINATAAHRAEAFVKTIGKWRDE